MRRIRKKIKRRVAALLAACMVTTSVPGNAFGAEMPDIRDSSDPENVVVHLDQERLKTAVENAVRNGDEYSEELKFYTEDEGNSQPELYNALFRDGDLYEVSLEDAAPATPSNAEAEDGEVTILVRPDLEAEKAEGEEKATPSDADSEEKATSSDVRRTGKATGSDADLSDYEATGNEQIIILFRNTGDNEVIYQIEVNGNLTPEISVPAGSTLVSDLASESDAEELEEETETEEPEAEAPAEDGSVPGNGSGGGSGSGSSDTEAPSKEESGEDASEEDSTEDSSENGSEGAPSEEEGGADSSESGNTEDSSEGSGSSEDSSADKENETEDTENGSGTVKPEGGTDAEAPEQGENGGQDSSEEPDSSENGSDSKEDSQDGADKSDNADSSHKGDSKPEGGSSDSGKQEGSKPESGKSESSKSENGSSDSGKSEGSGSEAEKKAEALTISNHLVPRVAAVGPSGEEYDPEASGLTPEEEWELFQAEGEDEEEEDYEEEESYEDELTTMAEISDTGVEGTILEPVLVKREKFSFFRSRMSSSRPVSAAAYVTTLAGLGTPYAAESEFTVDLFDYGTFDPKIDGNSNNNNYVRSNGTKDFNELISDFTQRNNNIEYTTDFLMAPVDGAEGKKNGATVQSSLIRGIVETQYQEGEDGLRFAKGLHELEKYGNTIFPNEEQYRDIKRNIKDVNNYFKAYYGVGLPLKYLGENHYRISSDDNYIVGSQSWGKRGIQLLSNGDSSSAHPYKTGAGFWPLNNGKYNSRTQKTGNQYFGMKFSTDFYLPEDGKWKGEPLKFTFTGDDDVWVFIDGQLVLDMGGLHQKVIGEIDFSTGYTKVKGNGNTGNYVVLDGSRDQVNQGTVNGDYVAGYIYGDKEAAKENAYQNKINKDYLESVRCTTIDKDKKTHTLDFYLVERAPYGSNCTIDFTLPTMPKGNLTVLKAVEGEERTPEQDYIFRIQKQISRDKWEDYEGGTFVLNKEGRKSFPLTETGVYRVAEIDSKGAEVTTWRGDGSTQQDGETSWQVIEVTDTTDAYTAVCTNSFIDRSQTHSLTVTKDVQGENTPSSIKFPFDIELDFEECKSELLHGITYKIGEDGTQQPVKVTGKTASLTDILLADGESVEIKGLPYGTEYTVKEDTEQLRDSLYTSVTQRPQTGEITTEKKTVVWVNKRNERIQTIDFNVEKKVTGDQADGAADEVYRFALYHFTEELNGDGSTFWEPYDGIYYVNGMKAESGFDLKAGETAEISIPVEKKGEYFLIRETDNGEADSTSWKVGKETVNSLDTPGFKPEKVDGKIFLCENSYTTERTLVVEKKLEDGSENPNRDLSYSFTVTDDNENSVGSREIKVGEDFEISVTEGETYTITENIPSQPGYQGSLARVEGAEKIGETSAQITITGEHSTEKKFDQIVHCYVFNEVSSRDQKKLQLLVVEMGTNGTPTWYTGTPVIETEFKSSRRYNRDNAMETLISQMQENSQEPYFIDRNETFYAANGSVMSAVVQKKLRDIAFDGTNSAPFVIWNGIGYELNEYMKYDVKERLQESEGGTITSIEMVDEDGDPTGYHREKYSGSGDIDGEEIENAATIRLRVTMDYSASGKHHVTFYNKWEQGLADMVIEKEITKIDTEDNTFLFEVTGEDGSKFYTSITIPAGETRETMTFEDIPAGKYTVEELDHMRYKLADGVNKSQTKTISAKGTDNTFTFENEKKSDGYFSDASITLNEVNGDGTYTQHKDSKEPKKGLYQELPAAILKDKHDDDGGTAEDGQVPPMD